MFMAEKINWIEYEGPDVHLKYEGYIGDVKAFLIYEVIWYFQEREYMIVCNLPSEYDLKLVFGSLSHVKISAELCLDDWVSRAGLYFKGL